MNREMDIIVLDLFGDEEHQYAYLNSRAHAVYHSYEAELLHPGFEFTEHGLQRKEHHLAETLMQRLEAREQIKSTKRKRVQQEIRCGGERMSRVYPLHAAETLEDHYWTYLTQDCYEYVKDTPVLVYRTNQSLACAVFTHYRYNPQRGTVAFCKPAQAGAAPCLAAAGPLDIVEHTKKIIQGIIQEKPGDVISGFIGFFKFLSGITSPEQEPLTAQLNRIVNQQITDAFRSLFQSGISSVTGWLTEDYYPRIKKPRRESNTRQIQSIYNQLQGQLNKARDVREAAAGPYFSLGGMAIYIAAQNLMNVIYDEMAQYDADSEDKRSSEIYTKSLPQAIAHAKEHISTTWPKIAEHRQKQVRRNSKAKAVNGTFYREYWCEDRISGYRSAGDDNVHLINLLVSSLKNLAADQFYVRLQIKENLDNWDMLLGKPPQPSPLEVMFIDVPETCWVYSDRGTKAHYHIKTFRPTPPAGYHLVGDYVWGSGYKATRKLLVLKETQPGALAMPLNYVQVWNDRGSGGKYKGTFWRPVCPPGYVALGDVTMRSYAMPPLDLMRVVRQDLVMPSVDKWTYSDVKSGAKKDLSVWSLFAEVAPYPSGCFIATKGGGNGQELLYGDLKRCWQVKAFYYTLRKAR